MYTLVRVLRKSYQPVNKFLVLYVIKNDMYINELVPASVSLSWGFGD